MKLHSTVMAHENPPGWHRQVNAEVLTPQQTDCP
jgi:hypothetical protein